MKKEELLKELAAKLSTGELSRDDVMRSLQIPRTNKRDHAETSQFSVAKMMYIIGATIVVAGIIFFVSQIWNDIGVIGRISITLGLGLVMTAMGSMLLQSKPREIIGAVFHAMGGLLIPGGAMVTLNELGTDTTSLWPVAITFGVIFAFYLLLNIVHKSVVLSFFAIANGTAFIYLVVESMIGGYWYQHNEIYAYLTMVIGIVYLLLSHAFQKDWNKPLTGILNFVGITGFFGAAFSRVFDSVLWQISFFLLVIGGLLLAVNTKSRSILVMSTGFLLAHVSYITSEYFADSIGWPITLILLGFVFIGLGYASIAINKKYITERAV